MVKDINMGMQIPPSSKRKVSPAKRIEPLPKGFLLRNYASRHQDYLVIGLTLVLIAGGMLILLNVIL